MEKIKAIPVEIKKLTANFYGGQLFYMENYFDDNLYTFFI